MFACLHATHLRQRRTRRYDHVCTAAPTRDAFSAKLRGGRPALCRNRRSPDKYMHIYREAIEK